MKVTAVRLALIALVMAAWAAHTPVARAAVVDVSAVPSKAAVAPGETFDVSIRVNSDAANRGMQFILSWDPAKATATSAAKGAYYTAFAQAHQVSVFWTPDAPVIDNAAGVFPKQDSPVLMPVPLAVALTGSLPAGSGVTGQGDVYVLHMAAKAGASGTVTFTLSQVFVGNTSQPSADLHPTVTNGTVTISGGSAAALAVTTSPAVASSITSTGATLKGNLTSLGNDSTVSVSFEYGTSTEYGSSTAGANVTAAGAFAESVSGLTAGTEYHYRAKAAGSATVYGSDLMFTTAASGETAAAASSDTTSQPADGAAAQTSTEPSQAAAGSGTGAATSSTPAASAPRTRRPATTASQSPAPKVPTTAVNAANGIDLSDALDASGSLMDAISQDVKFGTGDRIKFELAKGMRAVDADGAPVTAIGVDAPATLPDPPEAGRIVSAFELMPGGTVFNSPMTVSYELDPSALDDGESAEDLYLAYFDTQTNEWTPLVTVVDAENNRLTAEISHFSLYAVIAGQSGGLLSSLGNMDSRWSLTAILVMFELLGGVAAAYLWLRRKGRVRPAMAEAVAAPAYQGYREAGQPRQAKAAHVASAAGSEAPARTREMQNTVWDDLLREDEARKGAFKTDMEVLGGRVIFREGGGTEIEVAGGPNSKMVVSMEYDPGSSQKAAAKIVVRVMTQEEENGK